MQTLLDTQERLTKKEKECKCLFDLNQAQLRENSANEIKICELEVEAEKSEKQIKTLEKTVQDLHVTVQDLQAELEEDVVPEPCYQQQGPPVYTSYQQYGQSQQYLPPAPQYTPTNNYSRRGGFHGRGGWRY